MEINIKYLKEFNISVFFWVHLNIKLYSFKAEIISFILINTSN